MLSRINELLRIHGRACALVLALAALANGFTAVVLAATLNLDACHLCIFQRLIFFMIGAVLFIAAAGWKSPSVRNASLTAGGALSVWGMAVAAQQSWLQWYPQSGLSCDLAEISFTERLIDWLGGLFPAFFMATGACESKDLVIFWLSLANWSFLILFGFLVACLALLKIHIKARPMRSGDFD